MSTDSKVDITITLVLGAIEKLQSESAPFGKNGLEKLLKLYTTHSTSNMHLFDSNDKLKHYNTAEEIMNDYIVTRLELYNKRKNYQISALEKELNILSNKARFIQENLDDLMDLRRKTKEEIRILLNEHKFDMIDDDEDFKYLVKMPMDSVTKENADKIMKERDEKSQYLNQLKIKPITSIWLDELNTLENEYVKWLNHSEKEDNDLINNEENCIKIKKIVKRVIKKQK
jgi:DNA topoisomerase-2